MEGVIAKRYAKALLGLSPDPSKTAEELNALASAYSENPDFLALIAAPKLGTGAKERTIGEIAKAMGLEAQTTKFARFLAHKNRFTLIPQVANAFEKMALQKLGRGKAKMVTAFELTNAEVKGLTKKISEYTQLEVSLEVEVDKSILGGAITQIGSLVLDGSVKNRLNMIKETIARGI
ncbi:MAG: ATP synthase F1 subunit delta [Candidatus Lambdaproteobacteria bacterium RIFOXYD2_FULL_50_16]|uniref:ATP synthase subunit delta n=1 Tax=Candidatus Lambdaproteobacteria bacterium RIFOXYD2_FULL_50_16 TaxID=1817772 RepID=A0A1F6GEC9_9PROT|nr:MAG: ATP synthase F1 subunit delta [Candidatus Lambdaproteobacteria bacterium RIFOXYD2_FULL_50_16]